MRIPAQLITGKLLKKQENTLFDGSPCLQAWERRNAKVEAHAFRHETAGMQRWKPMPSRDEIAGMQRWKPMPSGMGAQASACAKNNLH